MSSPLVVGFGFTARCGKDFAVQSILDNYPGEAQRVAFADALKKDMDGWLKEHLGIFAWSDRPEEKEIIRPLLVAYGEAKRKQDPLHWVLRAYESIDPSKSIICISDVRYPNEAAAIKARGGFIVHVFRDQPPVNDSERINAPLCAAYADYTVVNHMDNKFLVDIAYCIQEARLRHANRRGKISPEQT